MVLFTNCKPKVEKAPVVALEDFFRNPERSSFQISPDGQYFSYTAPYERRMNIFIQKIGESESIRLTSETERNIFGYFWANNNRILFLKDTGGDENYHLYGVNINGSNLISLTAFEGVRTSIIDDLPEIENEIIISMNKRDPQFFDPYRLNIETGEMVMLAENPGNIMDWIPDHDGKLRIAMTLDGVNQSILYRETENDPFTPVITTSFKESLNPWIFTSDNQKIYATSNINRDKDALIVFNPKTGEEEELIYENENYDISGLTFSRKNKKLLDASYMAHEGVKRHFFDKKQKEIFEKIAAKVSNLPFGISDMNKNEDMFIIRTYNDKTPGQYFIYDVNKDELTFIADIHPWLDEKNMADMHCVKYATRDGLTIEGYLTLPKGYTMETAKNLPVVINPHGGPWARDTWGFNPEIQFLANRGYAVLQMNFRGSTGFGRKFWEISFKQWGQTMQDDITDGVNWLIKEGIADPDRIAIYGGSYGGYATLAGLAFTPDLYTCGIDYVGVSNLFTFLQTIPPYWKPMLDMMYEMVGDPVKDKAMLEKYSPVFHVDQINTPLFIAQGANDPRVNKDESDQMVEALKKRGIEVQYMVKDNEGHGFYNEENMFEFYGAMEKFLENHIQKNK
ncbi:S9 family peptidase [Bacteroidales bacterium OttesenSCG-928-C03]|nr:S9 family peptidase [Bacteroidales bacterium OttesenSCG-928-E04]MDL2308188.1 S9 family peptidase [Bacteroidales bacterium OttesenSCG-928-C03]MDL2325627.1 S9 family peptidase [Bacteroidales bacterium OttesenSCG-928-A14]